jgi:phosphoribosylformylglycinamidine cyclo-ligase
MDGPEMAITYRDAGVDIDSGDALVERIKPIAMRTRIPEVVSDIGGFAGLCSLPADIEDPLLVSGTDGVGTKLKVAFATGRHSTIGQDLVAMCVNDIITCGARPLFFLDYFASGHLDVAVGEQVVTGIADGCILAECALLGGETAELPGMYADGEYDLAGFAVGVVSRKSILGPDRVRPGDKLLGVASTGLHSNGYSLARRVIEQELKLDWGARLGNSNSTVADVLLMPTRIYAQATKKLKAAIGTDLHAMSHITGGGVPGNLPRVLPKGTKAQVRMPKMPEIFQLISDGGPVEIAEMRRTFNLGVGLVVALAPGAVSAAKDALVSAGEEVFDLGEVFAGAVDCEPYVEFV